jgi:hypothetical protein
MAPDQRIASDLSLKIRQLNSAVLLVFSGYAPLLLAHR